MLFGNTDILQQFTSSVPIPQLSTRLQSEPFICSVLFCFPVWPVDIKFKLSTGWEGVIRIQISLSRHSAYLLSYLRSFHDFPFQMTMPSHILTNTADEHALAVAQPVILQLSFFFFIFSQIPLFVCYFKTPCFQIGYIYFTKSSKEMGMLHSQQKSAKAKYNIGQSF